MEDVWKQVLAEIELEVSKPTFITFFKETRLVSVIDNVATISTSGFMNADYIEKRYYALIKKILDNKLGQNISIVFSQVSKKSGGKKIDAGPLFAKDVASNTSFIRPKRVRLDYTFDNFAVSESNQLAYTAATTVANNPGTKYNPLFLYGTVGVGKTHLMNAIANQIIDRQSSIKVEYLTTEEFTNEVVEAIRDKTTTQLRKKFRYVDLLLLDDIQFLSAKERVQEELFHTFNTLIDRNKQVVFSSDRPPHEIKKIEARLASRFEGGLTVDIQPPDFELRTAILLIKSRKYDVTLDVDGAKIAAEKILDTRALEGFLLRLSTEVGVGLATNEIVKKILGKGQESKKMVHPDDIIEAVCSFYHIKSTQIKGTKRDSFLVRPRHVCMYLLKEEYKLTLAEIGNLLGGRDHTTVIHGVEKIKGLLSSKDKINEEIVFIKGQVKETYLQ